MTPLTSYFKVKLRTLTSHISEFFGIWQNRRCLFTSDLRLFKSNTAWDEGISANSQTQHGRTINIWLAVASSQAFFFLGMKNRVNLVLFFKPWPGSSVPVRVTRGALVLHLYTYAPPCCRTSQYHMNFIPPSASLYNDLADSVFDGVRLAGFKRRENVILFA